MNGADVLSLDNPGDFFVYKKITPNDARALYEINNRRKNCMRERVATLRLGYASEDRAGSAGMMKSGRVSKRALSAVSSASVNASRT